LVLIRLIQGIAVGGEWGGAVLMALEHAPPSKKSFYASWPQAGVPAGVVLSSFAFYLVQLLPEDQLQSWGWRIPFLFSAVLIAVGTMIRLKLTESPEFEEMKSEGQETKVPFIELLRTSKRALFVTIFSLAGSNTLFYVATVYLLSYGTSAVSLDRGTILLAVSVGAFLDIFAIPSVATLADRYGRRHMMLVGSLVSITAAFPIFWLFNTGTTAGVFLALVVAMPIAHSCVYATVSGFIATLFGPQIRFTGTSMAYQLGGIVASAPAPILATMLYTEFNSYVAVAVYLVFTNVVAFVAVLFAPRDKAAKTGPVSPVVGAQSPHDLEEAR
jgi:MFS family permease